MRGGEDAAEAAAKSSENGSAIRDTKSQRREQTAREINVSPPRRRTVR